MRALLATLAIAVVAVAGLTLLAGGKQKQRTMPPTSGTATVALRPVPAPRLTDEQINRQDPPEARRQREEARVFDGRPLLNALPTTLQGVGFDIGGLAADGHTTIIRVDARGLGRRRARIAYATLRRRTGDRSRSYQLEIRP
jgi:hypothetical protein